ncbi:MAG: exopolyphosphatase, partial [Nitrospina sp.]|nr:exopolyphosphatase [Nitrospina sp.]
MSDSEKYRLVTRSDFDGLVSGMLLRHLDMIDEIIFVHPKDMQDGKIEITSRDITTNLPFVGGAHMAIDHHASEYIRIGEREDYINIPEAASASGVVYEYLGGEAVFPPEFEEMIEVADKVDSGNYSLNEVVNPEGWVLVGILLDPRTGIGRFKELHLSKDELMIKMIEDFEGHTANDVLAMPEIVERAELYFRHEEEFREQILKCSKVHGNLVVLDLREEEIIWPGNRFMIYTLFPDQNISIQVVWGKTRQNTVFATGKSISNFTSKTHVGKLMLDNGGGGHEAAGTC